MAQGEQYAVATVLSTRVLSNDRASILVEPGGFMPMQWFFAHGPRSHEETDQPPPKKKKRKIGGPDSHSNIAPVEAAHYLNPKSLADDILFDPTQHILVSRCTIDLHFPVTLSSTSPAEQAVREDVVIDKDDELLVDISVVDLFDNGTKLTLSIARENSALIEVNTTHIDNSILKRLKQHNQRLGPLGIRIDQPATICRRSISLSRGNLYTVVRLSSLLFWKTGVSAYLRGVPKRSSLTYPDYDNLLSAFPITRRPAEEPEQWKPQLFYDSIYTPPKTQQTSTAYEKALETQLFPFQKRTVAWMLQREGVAYVDEQIQKLEDHASSVEFNFYDERKDLEGKTCYVNYLHAIVTRERPPSNLQRISGGLLLEEMGLGKTVEILALITVHKRSEFSRVLNESKSSELQASKATLIVTPASILGQWQDELMRHTPALKVYTYEGVVSARKQKSLTGLVRELACDYDVVLTTYQTLTKEIHFAVQPPKRDMRRKAKFERQRSPLVEVQWWRVCLDEAQMVENSVSASARVALELPRVHSWAVTGTPLRRDISDVRGLLLFLGVHPLGDDARLWNHLVAQHSYLLPMIFGKIALRHTKAQVREDINLPVQNRVILCVPFSAMEQQHYTTLFAQMCEEVGLNDDGSPLEEDWDPSNPSTVEAMRIWLHRLRQTCLHPQVGGRNRRALGKSTGPLRTAAEVLELMIDQNETMTRSEERNLLYTQLRRGHILGNVLEDEHRSEKALAIYLDAVNASVSLVQEARQRLAAAKLDDKGSKDIYSSNEIEDSSSESTAIAGRLRNNLRTALQLQHTCTFFAATSYYQIKVNEKLTVPGSEQFYSLEQKERDLYESAKTLRKELLIENSRKAEAWMQKVRNLIKDSKMTKFPEVEPLENFGGIESRRILERSDQLFAVLQEQAQVAIEWRTKITNYLLKPLVDVDEGIEVTGDEYEDSTKLQDELYVYFDAVKALQADMNTFVTGQSAPLIDYEVATTIKACQRFLDPETLEEFKTNVCAPELALSLYAIRNKYRARSDELGSIRGLIQELRALENHLHVNSTGARAAERAITHRQLNSLQSIFTGFTRTLTRLEKEVDLFRSTQNQRLEFYRQLQEISDAVKPYREELDDKLDLFGLNLVLDTEETHKRALAQLKTKHRFLLNLRNESDDNSAHRMCVICQTPIENGVLTICGHQYCRECIHLWWRAHRACPMCKRKLTLRDFHDITYKPQELQVVEEAAHTMSMLPTTQLSSIYQEIDSKILSDIKSIDLPCSYGTKLDTLGRHIHWMREYDPGSKTVIFSQYRDFLDVLSTALTDFKIGFSRLGQTGAVDRFKHNPSVECLLLDAKTSAAGLTLVNATHVILCEPLVHTALELQAIARVHRIGQMRPTTVWMYLRNDSVEESVYELSVARRLEHLHSRRNGKSAASGSATPATVQENALDAANSEELEAADLSKLLNSGKNGGEIVEKDDLWQCLFGKVQNRVAKVTDEMEVEMGT